MNRRRFVQAGIAAGVVAGRAWAAPLGLPAGIQLYAVREPLAADGPGTLKALRGIGYREVETYDMDRYGPAELRRMVSDAGLGMPSAHLSFKMDNELGPVFAAGNKLGAEWAVSSYLRQLQDPGRASLGNSSLEQPPLPPMGLDGFKRMAARMNEIGRGARAAGLKYAYHNHNFEFEAMPGGGTGYDVLLRETDHELVKFEVDCGWMVAAGASPVEYFRRFPGRFRMLHVKDFLPGPRTIDLVGPGRPKGTELGKGFIDYGPIFAAAKGIGIEHAFAEQEAPYVRPQLESAKVSYDFLQRYG